MMNRMLFAAQVSVCFVLSVGVARGGNGVTQNEIVLGQSCALTGPAEALGKGMRAGMSTYFDRVNARGGIYGRKIRLVSKDDGYEPDRAIKNTRALIDTDRVFLLIGEVGTPTSQAVVPIAEESRVPFVGPFTGAEFLRNPFKPFVVNVRASYYQEMERLAQHLVDRRGLKKVSCFYQNDGYGQAGLNGIKIALKKRGLKLYSTATYERNTVAVKSAVLRMRRNIPEAIVMVGAYKPCAEFIKLCKKVGLKDVIYCNVSFVGTEALVRELGESGEGCIVSQVVRFPWGTEVPLVREYLADMRQYNRSDDIGFVSLEGYMVGKLFCMVAEKTGSELTRERFLETVRRVKTFEFGGVALQFGENDFQGMDEVFLTVVKNGRIRELT